MKGLTFTPIGVIRTPFKSPKGMPKGADASEMEGTVELSGRYAAGLSDLEGFSHILLVWHMHLSEGPLLMVRPWREKRPRGVFSTRSPRTLPGLIQFTRTPYGPASTASVSVSAMTPRLDTA